MMRNVFYVDGFTTNELKELLQSVVEKREGHKTADEAADEVRAAMHALLLCIDEIAIKLERKQFELPPMVTRTNPLIERSQTQKREEADVENLRWELTKKDENIVQLAKTLKGLEDNISFLKIQVEREKQKNSKIGRQDAGQQALNAEQIEKALTKEREKYEEEIEKFRSKLADLEKQLNEKDLQVKRIVSKSGAAALLDPSSYGLGADRFNALSNTKDVTRGPLQIVGFQQTPAELLQLLNSAHEKIRRLQAELDCRQLFELKPLNVPTQNLCGAETLRLRNTSASATADQLELQHKYLLDEANMLVLESKKLAVIPKAMRDSDSYRRQLNEYNKRAVDLRCRTRAFASRNYPRIPFPGRGQVSTVKIA